MSLTQHDAPMRVSSPAARPLAPPPRLLLVEYCDPEAVSRHPEVAPLLERGWQIQSVSPRLVESQGARLLVVLARPAPASPLKRIK